MPDNQYARMDTPYPNPPSAEDFKSLVQTCNSKIQQMGKNTAQIRSMVNQLGTKQDSSEMQDRLHRIQRSTKQLAKETNRYVKELASMPLSSLPAEHWHQKTQRDRVINDFSAALNSFQGAQRRNAEKEKESMAQAKASSQPSNEDSAWGEQLVSYENEEDFHLSVTRSEEAALTEEDLELMRERETSIRKLEADIMDVNQIFKDLAVMLQEQGLMIDSIEANVERGEANVEGGTEQLQLISQYRKMSRKRMCIVGLAILGALVVLCLIIWAGANR
ncbi:unnamed protein product [Ophioblennius macclurei]